MGIFNQDISQLNRENLLQILYNAKDCILYLEKTQDEINVIDKAIEEKQKLIESKKRNIEKKTKKLDDLRKEAKCNPTNDIGLVFIILLFLTGVVTGQLELGTMDATTNAALLVIPPFLLSMVFAIFYKKFFEKKREAAAIERMKPREKKLEEEISCIGEEISLIMKNDVQDLDEKRKSVLINAQSFCSERDFEEIRNALPTKYFSVEDMSFLIQMLEDRRADSWKEVTNLYEDYLHKATVEELQKKQLNASREIVEAQQATLEKMEKQNRQLKDISKQTRQTRNADRINALINLVKK